MALDDSHAYTYIFAHNSKVKRDGLEETGRGLVREDILAEPTTVLRIADMDLNSSQVLFTALNLICFPVIFCLNLLALGVKLQAKEVILPQRNCKSSPVVKKKDKSIFCGPSSN